MEIFQPHYGEGIARYIVADFQKRRGLSGSKLRICEVGAGNGTLAANVLDYVSRKHPDLYQDMEYTALEVSKPLSKKYVAGKCLGSISLGETNIVDKISSKVQLI